MKIIKSLILYILIFCHSAVFSKTFIASDGVRIDSTTVKYFVKDFNNLTLGNVYSWDTTTLLASNFDKLDNPYKIYQTLSNSGFPHKDISFLYPCNIGFNSVPTVFSSYLHNENNIKFPIVLQPFTDITYISGDNKEQHLDILFCREFLPRLFVAINYNVDFFSGAYKRTKMQNSFFNATFRYNTKNDRYGINAYYFHDKIDIQENGGIIYDSIFINNIETDKSIIDVNLTSATNFIKSTGFAINQYLNILPQHIKYNQDSVYRKHKLDIGRVNHHLSYNRNIYVYEDFNPLSSFYQNFDPIIDPVKTFDSIYFHNIKNVVYWNTLGYNKYNNDIPFYLTFGLEHNFTYHAGYLDLITQERFNNTNYSNLRANAGVIINLFKSTRITANTQIITTGYQAGDFFIEGQWKQFLGTSNKNIGALKFDINLNRQSADWFEEYYYSNNFRWNNDFKPAMCLLLQGSYQLPFLEVGVKQTNINNYIYFGENAKPQQYSGNISVSSLYTKFYVNLDKFEFVGFASLQTTNNDKIIHIPSFEGKIKFAYNINLVKNISMMQPSIAINYFTEYYADAYMPALRTFYLQDKVKVGNYPYVDLCVTFKIKNANVFVQYTNMYSITGDNRYFTTPHYPMRDSRFCLGVNWRLYK